MSASIARKIRRTQKMRQQDDRLLDSTVRRIMNEQQGQFAPQAVAQAAPQQGLPLNAVVALTQAGVLSPRQAFHWIFKQIEPTEFDGIVFKKGVEHAVSEWVDTGDVKQQEVDASV